MNVFGIGLPEMAVIAAIALLVFGPKRLPELGKTLGKTLKGFQSASQGFEEQFRTALDTSAEPSKDIGSAGAAVTVEAAPVAAAASPHESPSPEASSGSGSSAA